MKTVLLFLLLSGFAYAQLPDAPKPQPKTWEEAKGKAPNFFTYRTRWEDPPLRTSKQVFKSKLFWIGLGADFTAMTVACTHKGSGEECSSEAPAIAAIQGFKYVTYRFMDAGYGPAMDGYAVGHYIYSRVK